VRQYITNIIEAVVTIAQGMWVTLRTFFTRPETIQYPEVDVLNPGLPGYKGHLGPVQERFRGLLTVEPDSCIVDGACARVCPIDCIQMDGVKGPKTTAKNLLGDKDSPKLRYLTRFDIHIGRCMYCGLCVDLCPTGAIHFTREFEAATGDYSKLVRRCVAPEEAARVTKLAQEEDARKKAEEAKKAAEGGGEEKSTPVTEKKEGES
jgi:NAD(P)H-quinone oxidoreductase subunit I